MKQTITILGATGSIGCSTLAILADHPERFVVYALTCFTQIDKLFTQCLAFSPKFAVVGTEEAAERLQQKLRQAGSQTEVLYGEQALAEVSTAPEVETVMAAIVGAAGLLPTLCAAKMGKRILLANKETLVVAGALFMRAAKKGNATILPVDSEHNAIFQVLPEAYSGHLNQHGIESIILTASGGPFLHKDAAEFASITPAQAVAHPNWSMGQKISVDSATMMNKGLEVIEAHWLFGANVDQIEVVVHPQSVIHSMVRYIDGSVLAQMGTPDMRTPIANCLAHPARMSSGVKRLDFSQLSGLTFFEPDLVKFDCLGLAFEALKAGGDAPCVLNGANEIAVAAFLAGQIKFTDIGRLVRDCLEKMNLSGSEDINDLLAKDKAAREMALSWIKG